LLGREARLPATFVTKKYVTKSFVHVKGNKYLRKYFERKTILKTKIIEDHNFMLGVADF
jgi:hypothetical protein